MLGIGLVRYLLAWQLLSTSDLVSQAEFLSTLSRDPTEMRESPFAATLARMAGQGSPFSGPAIPFRN